MRSCLKVFFLLSLAAPMCLGADEAHGTPAFAVAAFHDALASGDQDAVLGLLDPGVMIFESGGAELSRDEYASHHLGADMEFSSATNRKIVDQKKGEVGDAGWVLTRSETSGTFRDKDIDILGTETVLLRRGEHGWRIVHIHWSSRSRSKAH
ncbi:MAG: YybH family protein [Thermoanaerobaculia bacterium]